MSNKFFFFFLLFSVTVFADSGFIDQKKVPLNKKTKIGLYMDSKNAFDFLVNQGEQSLFIDVRTRSEVSLYGMPTIADANIPLRFLGEPYEWNDKKNNFSMVSNPDFVSRVFTLLKQKGLTRNDKVFVMCRSGGRSAKAADRLFAAGFSQVISIIDGYEGDKVKSGVDQGKRSMNGWVNNHLPWTTKLDKNKMYFSHDLKLKDKQFKMIENLDVDQNGIVTQDELNKSMLPVN